MDGLVHKFVEPFGENVTTFLYLKMHDHSTKGKSRTENLKEALITQTAEHLEDIRREAARLPNVADFVVVEDDVTFRHPACGHFAEFTADNSTGDAWRAEETWQMLVGQLYNQFWCAEAMDRYTQKTGVKFDVALKSRPDVTFTSPMPPFCAFDYATQVCAARDWLFMLPGSIAVEALRRGYDEFSQCKTLMNRNKTKLADLVVRATGIGKELTGTMSTPTAACKKCGPNFQNEDQDCPGCKRRNTTRLRLLRRPGVPSGSLLGLLPRECGF